jgi:hypothetical protein
LIAPAEPPCGVARSIAAGQIAFFQHCDIGNTVLFRQIISSGKTVAAAADDDHIVGWLQRACFVEVTLRRIVAAQRVFQQAKRHKLLILSL